MVAVVFIKMLFAAYGSFEKLIDITLIFLSFSRGIFSYVTPLDQCTRVKIFDGLYIQLFGPCFITRYLELICFSRSCSSRCVAAGVCCLHGWHR